MTIPDQSPGPLDLLHPSMIAILGIGIDTFEIADENVGDFRQHLCARHFRVRAVDQVRPQRPYQFRPLFDQVTMLRQIVLRHKQFHRARIGSGPVVPNDP